MVLSPRLARNVSGKALASAYWVRVSPDGGVIECSDGFRDGVLPPPPRCRPLRRPLFGNRSAIRKPAAATMSSVEHPPQHLSSTRPSSPSSMLRLGCWSSCAGHCAFQPLPLRRTPCRCSRKRSMALTRVPPHHPRQRRHSRQPLAIRQLPAPDA